MKSNSGKLLFPRSHFSYRHSLKKTMIQTTKSPEYEQVLKWLELDKGIYQIGCTARRLTFHSQQLRAFNLIWCLQKEFGLAGKRVAVVGAGLAGLAAAAASHLLKAKVEIFEKKADCLPLQRGNSTRFVHPNIYTWPNKGSVYPVTHLPYFNWYDAEAGEVIRKILEQWSEIGPEIPQYYLMAVKKIYSKNGNVLLHFEDDRTSEPFDFALIAAGFGLEKELQESHTPSYWRNDSFDQPVLDKKPVITYCVCGAGDGALLDTIRLKVKDFRHRHLLDWMLKHPWFFTEAEHISDSLQQDKPLADIWSEFSKKDIPTDVSDHIKQALRTDTIVKLAYRGEHHFKTESSLLNRMIVALLIKTGDVLLERGEYQRIESNPKFEEDKTVERSIVVVKHNDKERGIPADRAILRVGTAPELDSLSDQYEEAKKFWDTNFKQDKTFEPCYPSEFLLDDFMPYEWESGYTVIFALGQSEDWDVKYVMQRQDRLNDTLTSLGKKLGLDSIAKQVELAKPKDFEIKLPSSGLTKKCTFQIKLDTELQTQNGHVAGPFISVSTASREILDLLLEGDHFPYHSLQYQITDKAKDAHIEVHRNLETNVHLFDERAKNGSLRVASHKGMYQTHKLLRARAIMEIMQNKWLPHRYQRLGWQLGGKYETERIVWRSVWQPPGE